MDEYIDNHETQTYGPKLRTNLTATFKSSPKPVRDFIVYLATLQKAADDNVASAMKHARGKAAALSSAANEAHPHAADARRLLTGFHKHLESKRDLEEWSGDVRVFFPRGLFGIGHSAGEVLAAVKVARAALEDDASVPEAKKFAKRFEAAQAKLEALTAKSGGAMREARTGLSEQSREKQDWLAVYRGAALIAHGLLVLEKKKTKLASVVPHLGVAGGRKKGARKGGATGEGTAKGG